MQQKLFRQLQISLLPRNLGYLQVEFHNLFLEILPVVRLLPESGEELLDDEQQLRAAAALLVLQQQPEARLTIASP